MNLLKFLLKKCRGMVVVTGLTALFSGGCNAGLIALVNVAVNDPDGTTAALVLGFATLAVGKIVTGFISQVWLIRFSQHAIADTRRELVRKILGVPLRQLEETGASRLMVALTDDVKSITAALFAFPVLAVNIAILLGGSIYLGWLSWRVLAVMCLFVAFGACGYRLLIGGGFRSLREVGAGLWRRLRGRLEPTSALIRSTPDSCGHLATSSDRFSVFIPR